MYRWGGANWWYNPLSSKVWKAKFFILCDVKFLVTLQGNYLKLMTTGSESVSVGFPNTTQYIHLLGHGEPQCSKRWHELFPGGIVHSSSAFRIASVPHNGGKISGLLFGVWVDLTTQTFGNRHERSHDAVAGTARGKRGRFYVSRPNVWQ